MRESFGGAFMIKLILVFIVIYISFMAVAVNYAKAFRVKNQVINIIEQYRYSGTGDQVTIDKINAYLASVAYYYGTNQAVKDNCDNAGGNLTDNGVCIVPMADLGSTYYKVITYVSIDFPFFDIHMIIPINGETKIIV